MADTCFQAQCETCSAFIETGGTNMEAEIKAAFDWAWAHASGRDPNNSCPRAVVNITPRHGYSDEPQIRIQSPWAETISTET
jgi:hypothetical protein